MKVEVLLIDVSINNTLNVINPLMNVRLRTVKTRSIIGHCVIIKHSGYILIVMLFAKHGKFFLDLCIITYTTFVLLVNRSPGPGSSATGGGGLCDEITRS